MGTNTGTAGTKEINKNYPVETGIGADDKHDGRIANLVPEKSIVPKKELVGI